MAGQRDARRQIEEALQVLKSAGWSIGWLEMAEHDDGFSLGRLAVENGVQVVIAAGGDGTVGSIAGGLVGSDVALAVFPVGTGNTWAKTLGYPAWVPPYRNPLLDVASGLLDATVRLIDVGQANGRYFLQWAGVGFDATIAREVEPLRDMRHRLGNLPYVVTSLSLAFSFRGTWARITADGQRGRARMVMALVSNAQLYGGGLFRLAPHALLDDGYLDLYVFRGQGAVATWRHFFTILTQYRVPDPGLRYHKARRIEIHTRRPMAVHLDGEPYGETPLLIDIVPQALKVLVPPTAPASLFCRPGTAVQVY